mgnify:CR=1 FL=1
MNDTKTPIHDSLNRPILMMGGERQLVLLLAIVAGIRRRAPGAHQDHDHRDRKQQQDQPQPLAQHCQIGPYTCFHHLLILW